jgi:single-strand selective monofunctional uracil DNA glycosylase
MEASSDPPDMSLIAIADELRSELAELRFTAPVTHVYNPLDYAWSNYTTYLERFGSAPRDVVLLGMNPGPWGMMQTGVPFGDKDLVRDWMRITGEVSPPARQHPRRPILGFDCPRGEISGQRLWGWASATFGRAESFFARFFVLNYCPLCFLEENGRNRTPDKLARAEQAALFEMCDRALVRSVQRLAPHLVVGIGRFAAERAGLALDGMRIGTVPHPSPANPNANRDWPGQMNQALAALGVSLP